VFFIGCDIYKKKKNTIVNSRSIAAMVQIVLASITRLNRGSFNTE